MASDTVLVVDDNEQIRMLVQANLVSGGYGVRTACNGPEAIERFQAETPDLVLLDVVMPGIDGFETCRRLRTLQNGPDVPIVFLTALNDMDANKQALDAGGDDLLTKPIHRTELIMRVRSMLWMRRLRTELRSGYNLISSQRDTLILTQKKKDELANFLVHDLKSPITNVMTSASLLLDSEHVQADPATAQLAAYILEAGKTIERMILNLLDINRSEDGMLVPKIAQADVAILLDEARRSFDSQARFREVELRVASARDLSPVYLDSALIGRTIENLLANALRFSPRGAKVGLEASAVDGLTVRFCVRDEGLGIPKEYREKVFEKYVRIEDGAPAVNQGLGLTFCRAAVEVHGGRIWVEENPPAGACLCFELPCLRSSK